VSCENDYREVLCRITTVTKNDSRARLLLHGEQKCVYGNQDGFTVPGNGNVFRVLQILNQLSEVSPRQVEKLVSRGSKPRIPCLRQIDLPFV
jgi:hypothetical protein